VAGASGTQDQDGTDTWQMETRLGAGNRGPTLSAGLSLCSAHGGRRQRAGGCPCHCKVPGMAELRAVRERANILASGGFPRAFHRLQFLISHSLPRWLRSAPGTEQVGEGGEWP